MKWAGFTDPHSGLDYFRVALGSSPGLSDVVSFVYVGKQTCKTKSTRARRLQIINIPEYSYFISNAYISLFFHINYFLVTVCVSELIIFRKCGWPQLSKNI